MLLALGNLGLLPPDDEDCGAYGLNDTGMVVGASGDFGGVYGYHAFLWMDGIMCDLGTAHDVSYDSHAMDVNNAGVVLGIILLPGNSGAYQHFALVPEITPTGDLTWFQDADDDGLNDLMQPLGTNVDGVDISNQGWIATAGATVLIPLDTDDDGKPDTWFMDEDADGANDLVHPLRVLDLSERPACAAARC